MDENVPIFNEMEKQYIQSEYVYKDNYETSESVQHAANKWASTVMKTKTREEAANDGRLDIWDFYNMSDVLHQSTEDPQLRNMSSQSDILGPFNTSRQEPVSEGEFEKEIIKTKLFVDAFKANDLFKMEIKLK